MQTQHADDIETVYPKGQRSRAASFVKHSLALAAVFGLALLAASGVQRWLPAAADRNLPLIQGAVSAPTQAVPAQAVPALPAPRAPVAAPAQAAAWVTPQLSATLVVDGVRAPQSDDYVMAEGSTFELLLATDYDGQVQLMAVNPAGQATRLWGTHLQAGAEHQSPRLRLQGLRGVETLRILFKPDAHYGQSGTVLKQMKILHL